MTDAPDPKVAFDENVERLRNDPEYLARIAAIKFAIDKTKETKPNV